MVKLAQLASITILRGKNKLNQKIKCVTKTTPTEVNTPLRESSVRCSNQRTTRLTLPTHSTEALLRGFLPGPQVGSTGTVPIHWLGLGLEPGAEGDSGEPRGSGLHRRPCSAGLKAARARGRGGEQASSPAQQHQAPKDSLLGPRLSATQSSPQASSSVSQRGDVYLMRNCPQEISLSRKWHLPPQRSSCQLCEENQVVRGAAGSGFVVRPSSVMMHCRSGTSSSLFFQNRRHGVQNGSVTTRTQVHYSHTTV